METKNINIITSHNPSFNPTFVRGQRNVIKRYTKNSFIKPISSKNFKDRWVAELVPEPTATLWVRIRVTQLKNHKMGIIKKRSGQHILARQNFRLRVITITE
jgi:hypothetical protein